jgi:DNA-binding FrmR family transcriptional regulator
MKINQGKMEMLRNKTQEMALMALNSRTIHLGLVMRKKVLSPQTAPQSLPQKIQILLTAMIPLRLLLLNLRGVRKMARVKETNNLLRILPREQRQVKAVNQAAQVILPRHLHSLVKVAANRKTHLNQVELNQENKLLLFLVQLRNPLPLSQKLYQNLSRHLLENHPRTKENQKTVLTRITTVGT